jgi:hypothetical protein
MRMRCVFSGVRPSSGAETQGGRGAFGQSEPLERADVAAAEDGRTPLSTFGWKRGPVRESSELRARIAPLNWDWPVAQAFQPAGSGDFRVASLWSAGLESPYVFSAMVGMARCAVPARVVTG